MSGERPGRPARPPVPDRILGWVLTVLLTGVGINIVSSFLDDPAKIGPTLGRVVVVLPEVLLVLVALATAPGGLFSPGRGGGSNGVRLLAILAGAGYLIVGYAAAETGSVVVSVASIACLWLLAVLLAWRALPDRPVTAVAAGFAFLLGGVAFLLVGVELLWGGDTLDGVAFLLGGVAVLLVGVVLLWGGDTLFGVAFLLVGVAVLLVGVAFLWGGDTLAGVAVLLGGVAVLLAGVALLGVGDTLFGVAFLLAGVAFLLAGVAVLQGGDTLFGAAFLLGGLAALLWGVAVLRTSRHEGGGSWGARVWGWMTRTPRPSSVSSREAAVSPETTEETGEAEG